MEKGNFDSHIATLERVDNRRLCQDTRLAGKKLKERLKQPESDANSKVHMYRLDNGAIGCSTEETAKQGVALFYDFKMETVDVGEANRSGYQGGPSQTEAKQFTISWLATNLLVDDIEAPYGTITAAEYKIDDKSGRITKQHTERLLQGDWQGEAFSLGRHVGDMPSIMETNLSEDEVEQLASLQASYADLSERDSADHTMIRTVLQQLDLT